MDLLGRSVDDILLKENRLWPIESYISLYFCQLGYLWICKKINHDKPHRSRKIPALIHWVCPWVFEFSIFRMLLPLIISSLAFHYLMPRFCRQSRQLETLPNFLLFKTKKSGPKHAFITLLQLPRKQHEFSKFRSIVKVQCLPLRDSKSSKALRDMFLLRVLLVHIPLHKDWGCKVLCRKCMIGQCYCRF